MPFIAGRGGASFLLFDADMQPQEIAIVGGFPVFILTTDLAEWSIQTSIQDTDVTSAGVVGSRGSVIGSTLDWSISVPVAATPPDPPLDPEDPLGPSTPLSVDNFGVIPGSAVTVWLEIANMGCWHKITNSLVTSASVVNNSQGDAVRLMIRGRYGNLDLYTSTEPAAPPPPPTPPG